MLTLPSSLIPPHPFPSKGLFPCLGHRQSFLCSHPCFQASHIVCSMPCSVPCAFLFPPFPHPLAFGFSGLTDKAEILISPSSMNVTTTFPFLTSGSLSFLRGCLVLVQRLQQKVSFHSFKPLHFPVLSPSVSHTITSPKP